MKKNNSKENIVKKREKVRSPTIARFLLVGLILLLEIVLLVLLIVLLDGTILLYISTFLDLIISIIVGIVIVNSKSSPSYKITWLFFMLILPIPVAIFYLLFANKKFSKREYKKLAPSIKSLNSAMGSEISGGMLDKIDRDSDPDAYNIAKYLKDYSYNNIYADTNVTYFAWGEDAFPIMLEKLKLAKHYIFMEYFIIAPGRMWEEMLDILIDKAKEGVDVRLLYDDLGCVSTLPKKYYKTLEKYGIKCHVVSPLKPFLDIRMNNRDHRKIMVIDGHTGFTGGLNIADEYINEKLRFGKWKDNQIMLEGEGVFGLTALFISTWIRITNDNRAINFLNYLPMKYGFEAPPYKRSNGLVQPYGSLPYTFETVGQNVYVNLCLKAKKYLYITTPYLILDDQMQGAIMQAAKNGVQVKLLIPAIPDKKIVYELTKSYAFNLIKVGVEVYEYTPGFVHAKTFLVDGVMGTVGTINLDYRSLYLHMENGTFLYKCDCLKDIEKDMEETFRVSRRLTMEDVNKVSGFKKFIWALLKVFAPLM